MKNIFKFCLLFLWLSTILSCAEQPKVMEYFPGKDKDEGILGTVWPAPPEIPRYRFAGQLIGEQNFVTDQEVKKDQARNFFMWLVGLTNNRNPLRLARPQNGMVDENGRIIVTDIGKRAIFVFDTTANNLTIWDKADGNAEFASPIGISASVTGEFLVTDSKLARVVKLDQDGNPIGSFGSDILERPTGITVSKKTGNIYVADTSAHNIKIFDRNGVLIDVIGQRGIEPGEFNAPTYLYFAKGKLYVSDTLNARIQILSPDGEPLSSIGKRGLFVGNLTHPKGITVDSDGNIYIIESYYDHLLVFNSSGEFLLPIGGTGGAIGNFFLPAGVWSDSQDRIFTADMFNGRIIIMQYLGE